MRDRGAKNKIGFFEVPFEVCENTVKNAVEWYFSTLKIWIFYDIIECIPPGINSRDENLHVNVATMARFFEDNWTIGRMKNSFGLKYKEITIVNLPGWSKMLIQNLPKKFDYRSKFNICLPQKKISNEFY